MDGDAVTFSRTMLGHGESDGFLGDLIFRFDGKVDGEQMSGPLDMGEYLGARWSARRYTARRPSQQQEG